MEFIWSHIATALSSITIVLLGYLINKGGQRDEKFDAILVKMNRFMTLEECKEERKNCPACIKITEIKKERMRVWDKHEEEDKDFEHIFFRHSHTALPEDSVVRVK